MSSALTAQAARVSDRLAALLRDQLGAESAAGAGVDFLTRWHDVGPGDAATAPVLLNRLAVRYGLSRLELELVVLAGLADEHQGVSATFRSLHPTGDPRPTLGLAALYAGANQAARDSLRATVAEGPAFAAGLLRLAGDGPLFERSLVLGDALWSSLHGDDAWPAALPRVGVTPPTGLDDWLAGRHPQRAVAALAADDPVLVLVTGEDEAIGLARCAALAYAARDQVVGCRTDLADPTRLALLAAHACLRDAVPLVLAQPGPDAPQVPALSAASVPGALLAYARPGAVRPAPDRPVIWLPAAPVGDDDRHAAWRHALPGLPIESITMLAARHRLDPAVTAQLGLDLGPRSAAAPASAEVAGLIRTRLAATLPPGVDLTTPDVPWSDLVLPAEGAAQLADAVGRLDHHRLVLDEWHLRTRAHALNGARLLLCGPPGTGKSLAARAVATAAGTDLLVVDVSRIVSKWLGETEKNLAAAFDAAERTQAVLMLDEADALFGTRTEISDAHDRYANLETAYLLARLDRFEGLAILTTNMRNNIDPAFLRRIDHLVEFPLPDRAARLDLWRRHLPLEPLGDDLELEPLAGLYPVSGAWIRNVSVAAAYAAAAAGTPIEQSHLVDAMRREYAKSSLPFPGAPPRRRHDLVG